ncbi:Uncharacterised protein [Kluyvera cryocrescens]|uniref:T3SS EscN ATPase C-terminal domain-containing protein n=1 Tax=Kluyvera cryocrescens TaxID=580 RepID=A0A485AJD9_KLUCR|nr:Uncharacterised protein [Kluyvera cryocrescens]
MSPVPIRWLTKAVRLSPAITQFLQQEVQDAALIDSTINDLRTLAQAG